MITLTREEAQQIADSLAGYRREMNEEFPCDAERMLVARLSAPEPEPVAFMDKFGQVFNPAENQCYIRWKMRDKLSAEEVPIPLYTAPPQREWKGLTDEEIKAMRHMRDWTAGWTDIKYAREIEAKLKLKNFEEKT